MVSVLGFETGISLPSITTSGFGGTFTIVAIILLVVIAISIGVFIYLRARTYNKIIILYENISGMGWRHTYTDRARILKIGDGGEEILYLLKAKVYRTAYGKKMGKNTYWFAKGQDGYWYNVVLGDLDAKMGMLDIEPIDRDMRYMHVAIRKNIQERYKKTSFMEKYGAILMNGVFLLIMIIALWMLINQIGDLMGSAQATVETSKGIIEPLSNLISKLDSMYSGGTGITPSG